MKKVLLTMLTLLVMGQLISQNADSTAVLQKCIDLEELQAFLPKELNGTMKPVYLMKRDVVFPPNIDVVKFDLPLVQMKRDQIVNQSVEAFFMFHEFHLTFSSALVKFTFVHDSPKHPKTINATLELEKNGEKWVISKSTLTN
jgi:hypothetical protein